MPGNNENKPGGEQVYTLLSKNVLGMLDDNPVCRDNPLLQELKELQAKDASEEQLREKMTVVFQDSHLMMQLRLKVKDVIAESQGQALFRLNEYTATMDRCKTKLCDLQSEIKKDITSALSKYNETVNNSV